KVQQTASAQKKAGPLNTSTWATSYDRRCRQVVASISNRRANLGRREEAVSTGQPNSRSCAARSSQTARVPTCEERKLPITSTDVLMGFQIAGSADPVSSQG